MTCRTACIWAAVALAASSAAGEVSLPAVFSDHAVFQRGVAVPVWGKAAAGQEVTVAFAGQRKTAVADAAGNWAVRLDPLAASEGDEGGELVVSGGGSGGEANGGTIIRRDILVGEVWVCSGQSNMEWLLCGAMDAEEEIRQSSHPRIRLLTVEHETAEAPLDDCKGRWARCDATTAPYFSAAAYFFGRDLHKALKVPIGLINASWSGSPAEPWTPRAALERLPEFAERYSVQDAKTASYRQAEPEALKAHEAKKRRYDAAWRRFLDSLGGRDEGTRGRWQDLDLDTSGWRTGRAPDIRGFHVLSGFALPVPRGVVWVRRDVHVPPAWAGRDLVLSLGPVDDADDTYLNGTRVGGIGHATPDYWKIPRVYDVPGAVVRPGRNVIAVRVTNLWGPIGLIGLKEMMTLSPKGATARNAIALAGAWKYKVGCTISPVEVPREPPRPKGPAEWFGSLSAMYNGMIAPLVPYGTAGVIWYQGESNVARPEQYADLFAALIGGWRAEWGRGELPFLFVQLANLGWASKEPEDGGWPRLRESQAKALALPKTGMAVAIDVGEALNIHPKNKQAVGRRLALAALGVAYGRDVVHSGPTYESMAVEAGKVRLRFAHVGGGLMAAAGSSLKQFAVAGADRKFVWAEAKVDGRCVVVWSDKVPEPAAVRYAWARNPAGCNLYNVEGLPAPPFRTDDWPVWEADEAAAGEKP